MVGRISRRAVRVSVAALMAGSSIVIAASTCWACECAQATAGQVLDAADAAFVGEVVNERILTPTSTIQVFEVEAVYKGQLGPTVEVIMQVGAGGGSSCGVLFSRGQRLAVALTRLPEGTFTTTLCQRLSPEEIERVGGTPLPPDSEISPAPQSPPVARRSSPLLPDWAVVPLGALGALALMVAAVWLQNARARRRPAADPSDAPGG